MKLLQMDTVTYHRNGVGGAGYYHVLFWQRDGRRWRKMQAVVFSTPEHIAILDDEDRSYRYEDFEAELRAFIESPDAQQMAFPHLIANEA